MKYLFLAVAFVLSTSPVFAQNKGKTVPHPPQKAPAPIHKPIQQYKTPAHKPIHKPIQPIQQHYKAPQHIHPHIQHVQPHYTQKNIHINNHLYNNHLHNHAHINIRPLNNYYVGGTYYRGRNYNNWSNYCYFPAHRCYGFYCGVSSTWFYWYAPQNCFLPTYYMQTMPPVIVADTPMPANITPIQVVPPVPQVLNFETTTYHILITVNDRIRDTGDMMKATQNQSRIKAQAISRISAGIYLVTVDSNLSHQEICGTFSRLPNVIYAELHK